MMETNSSVWVTALRTVSAELQTRWPVRRQHPVASELLGFPGDLEAFGQQGTL